MNAVKSLVVVALLSLVLAPLAAAQTQFQQVVEIKVKPGHEKAYEDLLLTMKEAAEKVGSPTTWNTFTVSVGKTAPTYRIVIPFEKWGERDSWQIGPQMLEKALGKEEVQRVRNGRAGAVESAMIRIWEQLPDGSSNLSDSDSVAKFYQVTVRQIRPDRVNEYRAMQRKFKAAYEKAGKPWVTRSVQRFGESPNTTFRRAQSFNTWSERDNVNVLQILSKEYGEDWNLMQQSMNEMVIRTEIFVSAHRPDLSRPNATPTTN